MSAARSAPTTLSQCRSVEAGAGVPADVVWRRQQGRSGRAARGVTGAGSECEPLNCSSTLPGIHCALAPPAACDRAAPPHRGVVGRPVQYVDAAQQRCPPAPGVLAVHHPEDPSSAIFAVAVHSPTPSPGREVRRIGLHDLDLCRGSRARRRLLTSLCTSVRRRTSYADGPRRRTVTVVPPSLIRLSVQV